MQNTRQTTLDFSKASSVKKQKQSSPPPTSHENRDREAVHRDFQNVLDRIQDAISDTAVNDEDDEEVCIMSQHDPNNDDDNNSKRPSSYLTMIPNQTIHDDDDQAPRIRPRETTHHQPKMSDVVQRFRQNMKSTSSPPTISLLNDPNVSVKEAEQRMLERIRMKKRKKNDNQV
ncbi:hypothetical protein O0I10_005610 [Lichtheimia ornata]|uniref:Uncharacterized protein n=1 Tax=Lichtheimia ornata TaxID=688661 RepID=A0AAD7V4B3_9FUNG|nr:uncharacterized protein O0I10_005610 [Lichtheimia ornata]KAJ8658570.1 hypothetical protein O0I10_005610 [Lichtheimia ornata]